MPYWMSLPDIPMDWRGVLAPGVGIAMREKVDFPFWRGPPLAVELAERWAMIEIMTDA